MKSVRAMFILTASIAAVLSGGAAALLGACGPFNDIAGADPFCPFVLEIFTLGVTTGATATTYDPTGNVTRLQMAAFLSRSVDGLSKRGSRRAALGQFWINGGDANLSLTTLSSPVYVAADGTDVWASNDGTGSVFRVRASDGKLLETWTGATSAVGVLAAVGRIYVTGYATPSKLYRIDPGQTAGAVTTVATNLGQNANSIAYDGSRFWTANTSGTGSVSIVTPGATIPWTVTTVTVGSGQLWGAVFDGLHVWVTDYDLGKLLKLDANGAILQTVTLVSTPQVPVFDGANIWVPNNFGSAVSVVRASSGVVLATLTGNGLNNPATAAFDGERVLITNYSGNSVSLFKAADLSPIGFFATGASSTPYGACSDGINFWIALRGSGRLARF
jgi:hypothetical protein